MRAQPPRVTILFLTTVLPGEASTGGESASRAFVESLRAAGNRVVVVGYLRRGADLKRGPDDRSAGTRHIETDAAGTSALAWLAKALALQLPYSVAKYRSRRYVQTVQGAISDVEPELLILDHAQASAGLAADARVPFIYLAHNVEHRLYRTAAQRGGRLMRWLNRREAKRIEALERDLAARAREVWALSEADGHDLERMGAESVRVFALPPTVGAAPMQSPRHDVVILGTWTWHANEVGLRWFLDEVHPLLPPATRIAVAGRGSEAVVGELSNVTCVGFVDDPASFLGSGRIVVVPAVAGEGIQVKTLDAIAAARPTVLTRLALRGIPSPPPSVRIADEPTEMAAAIAELLRDPPSAKPDAEAVYWADRRRAEFDAALSRVEALA